MSIAARKFPSIFPTGRIPAFRRLFSSADEGWTILKRPRIEGTGSLNKGAHGFDPYLPSMGTAFIAEGPALRKGVVIPAFDNIEVYNLACARLGIHRRPMTVMIAWPGKAWHLRLGTMKLNQILETALHAADLDAAEHFYTGLLGCEPNRREAGRFVFYKLEEAMFLLFNPAATGGDNHGIPPHGTTGAGHVCFRIGESDTARWKARLSELGIPLEAEHPWSNGTVSLYFRDPEGNSIELAPWKIWERAD